MSTSPVPAGQRGRRPGSVTAAGLLTIIGSLIGMLGAAATIAVYQDPAMIDELVTMMNDMNAANASRSMVSTMVDVFVVIGYVAIGLAAISLALGVMLLRGSPKARTGIMILAPIACVLSIGQLLAAIFIIPMAIVAMVQASKAQSRAWLTGGSTGAQGAYAAPAAYGAPQPYQQPPSRTSRFPVTAGPPTSEDDQTTVLPTYGQPTTHHGSEQQLPEGWRPPATWVPPDDWAPHPSWNPPKGWVPPASWEPPPGWTPPEPQRPTRRAWDDGR